MNSNRALFQLWLIGTAIWSIGWTILVRQNCLSLLDGQFWCRANPDGWLARFGSYAEWSPLEVYLLGLAAPGAILLAGVVLIWLRSRLSQRP